MRKIAGYLLLFYFILIVGLVLYNHLAPPPPPEPPSAWDMTWREHGNIVAFATIAMLAMIELAVGILILGGVLVLLKKGWTIWANSVGRSGGLAPVLREKDGWYDPNPDGAIIAAAIAAHAPRVTASMVKHMMGVAMDRGPWSVQDTTYQDASVVDAPYQVVEEFRPDMVNARGHDAQHHIFVGPTGSGKSVAAFSVLDQIKQQQPHAAFLIFEPGRVEWKDQAVTGDFEELFMLVEQLHEEMRRRQQMLAAHPTAKHAFELGLPPVVLFIEEAGSALDYYKLSPEGVKKAKEFTLYLRNLLREARKTGISVILVDQAAMAETIPTQVLVNVPHVWLMVDGASPRQWRRWGLTEKFRKLKEAGLLEQRPGLAFDFHGNRLVQFPLRERPRLMLKAPDLDNVLKQVRKTTGSNNGQVQQPPSNGTSRTVVSGPSRPSQANANVRYVLPPTRRPDGTLNDDGVRADRQNVVSEATAWRVYMAYKRAGSYNGAQQKLFPGQTTGGYWFYWIRDIVQQMEGKPRSRPMVTIEKKSQNQSQKSRSNVSAAASAVYRRDTGTQAFVERAGDGVARKLAERHAARVPYAAAQRVLNLYRRYGDIDRVYRHLWPNEPGNDQRKQWLMLVVEQMLRGRPDSYGPVVVVGWPEE